MDIFKEIDNAVSNAQNSPSLSQEIETEEIPKEEVSCNTSETTTSSEVIDDISDENIQLSQENDTKSQSEKLDDWKRKGFSVVESFWFAVLLPLASLISALISVTVKIFKRNK